MPTWGQLLRELSELQQSTPEGDPNAESPHDRLRRKYLRQLSEKTGRATIVYATDYLGNRPNVSGSHVSINLGDVQGFMEAVSNVEERSLDLILHSPGGSAEAAESIVEYLRTRFGNIRVIVPLAAMSAATMLALAADEIVMGAHSQLGPIDPQFSIMTPEGPRSAPGQAILDQFELAKAECRDPANIGAWLPLLRSLLPGLIAQCTHQRQLAEDLVARWLERYMFAKEENPEKTSRRVADWFSDFSFFKSHGRRVSRDDARQVGVKVIDLESAPDGLQDAVLSVHHAYSLTFAGTGTTKLIENHHGRAYLEMVQVQQVLVPNPAAPQLPSGPPTGNQPTPGNRAARRRRERDQR